MISQDKKMSLENEQSVGMVTVLQVQAWQKFHGRHRHWNDEMQWLTKLTSVSVAPEVWLRQQPQYAIKSNPVLLNGAKSPRIPAIEMALGKEQAVICTYYWTSQVLQLLRTIVAIKAVSITVTSQIRLRPMRQVVRVNPLGRSPVHLWLLETHYVWGLDGSVQFWWYSGCNPRAETARGPC